MKSLLMMLLLAPIMARPAPRIACHVAPAEGAGRVSGYVAPAELIRLLRAAN